MGNDLVGKPSPSRLKKLLAAATPSAVDAVLSAWAKAGIKSCRLGSFGAHAKKSTIRSSGMTEPLTEPGIDPFWPLFFARLTAGPK